MNTIDLLVDLESAPQTKAVVKEVSADEFSAKVSLEPLRLGMGHTLGNPLRRTLLSLMPGFAIVGVAIDGVRHQYDSIDGVKENVVELLLNCKQIAVSLLDKHEHVIHVSVSGKDRLLAADLQVDSSVIIHNPEFVLAHMSEQTTIDMRIYIGSGQGYVQAGGYEYGLDLAADFIKIDAIFNPVKRVAYKVEQASAENNQVDQNSDSRYDKLVFDIQTNGSTTAKLAVQSAAAIMQNCLSSFIDYPSLIDKMKQEERGEEQCLQQTKIADLALSVRSLNCLQQEGIHTVAELVNMTEKRLLSVQNLGRVSLKEIRQAVHDLGFSLKSG